MFKKEDCFVRCFTVSDPQLHEKGYTVYKVTSQIINVNSPETPVTETIVWKRYNEFKKLHKSMAYLHKCLHRKETFPPFVPPKMFGRYEAGVLQERQQAAQDLLNFLGQRSYLVKSKIYQQFFEGGAVSKTTPDLADILQPVKLHEGDPVCDCPEDSEDMRTKNQQARKSSLGGVWNYPKPAEVHLAGDDVSIDDDVKSEDSNSLDLAVDSSAFRDVIAPRSGNLDSVVEQDELENLRREFEEGAMTSPPPAPSASTNNGSSSSLLKPPAVESAASTLPSPSLRRKKLVTSSASVTEVGSSRPVAQHHDYIMNAAQLIILAQECECEGNYQQAFTFYKQGVGYLLHGVQGDNDEERREAVRRKTARYLRRAEDIYQRHLVGEEMPRDRKRWETNQTSVLGSSSPATLTLLQMHRDQLAQFQVLGIVDKVLLVKDQQSGDTFVIKALIKSSTTPSGKTMVPHAVPFCVNLRGFIETNDAIFLVLQYAPGGKLWSYVSGYLQQHNNSVTHGRKSIIKTDRKSSDVTVPEDDEEDVFTDSIFRKHSRVLDSRARDVIETTDADWLSLDGSRQSTPKRRVANHRKSSSRSRDSSTGGPFNDVSAGGKAGEMEFFSIDSSDGEQSSRVGSVASELAEHVISSARHVIAEAENELESTEDNVVELSQKESRPRSAESRRRRSLSVGHSSLPALNRSRTPSGGGGGGRMRRRRSSLDTPLRKRNLSTVFSDLDLEKASHLVLIPEICIKQWAAELVVAISCLHRQSIIIRDLKPDNLLLGERGHVLVSFISYWSSVDRALDRSALEHYYVAPEVSTATSPSPECDYWSLGAIMFELLTGKSLASCITGALNSHSIIPIPDCISAEAQSLLTELLRVSARERLGAGVSGEDDVKSHPFFAGIDWEKLETAGLAMRI